MLRCGDFEVVMVVVGLLWTNLRSFLWYGGILVVFH